jgi:hypothetical protein
VLLIIDVSQVRKFAASLVAVIVARSSASIVINLAVKYAM